MNEGSFDAVAWMRARRTEIDGEDAGLSWETKHKKMRESLKNNPLWLRLRGRGTSPVSGPVTYVDAHVNDAAQGVAGRIK